MHRNERFELTELMRRVANMIRPGVVHEVRHKPYAVRVKIGDLITGWLTPLVERAGNNQCWDSLEPSEQVLVLSPDGNLSQGWVLPAGYTDQYPQPEQSPNKAVYQFSDGARIEYDRKQHQLKALLPAGATTELISSGGITITGDLLVNGNIRSTQEIADKTRSMSGDRDIYNNHVHAGVLPGPNNTASTGQKQ